MEFGLIGKTLKHSFSKLIHEKVEGYKYDLVELKESELDSFLREKDFNSINVTIPYKESVIPYLDEIDDSVKNIGACNVITNRDGKLKGYNTDYLGIIKMLKYFGIDLKDKTIAILGTGGTSKTSSYVCELLGVKKVYKVSRTPDEETISFIDLLKLSDEIEIIINTTPVGMYPNNFNEPVELKTFKKLEAVVDVVYNPIKTKLIVDAEKLGLKVAYGLYMLVAQAFYGIELFKDKKINEADIEVEYNDILNEKKNIVLIGMPGCGKSTVGKILAKKLNKTFVDSDAEIVKKIKCDIASYIKVKGEKSFREVEQEVIQELSVNQGYVISTGGGAILREINVDNLKQNGIFVFVDRDLNKLVATPSRPLSSNKDDLKKRYYERIDLYNKYADIKVTNNTDVFADAAEGVIEKL